MQTARMQRSEAELSACLQAAQVRKCSYVAGQEAHNCSYHPDTHHACTVYAGTTVYQVSPAATATLFDVCQSLECLSMLAI